MCGCHSIREKEITVEAGGGLEPDGESHLIHRQDGFAQNSRYCDVRLRLSYRFAFEMIFPAVSPIDRRLFDVSASIPIDNSEHITKMPKANRGICQADV